MAKSKLYTKVGDQGSTFLFGGSEASKASLQVEAYGTLDELNVSIGKFLLHRSSSEFLEEEAEFLTELQSAIFTISSHVAYDGNSKVKLPSFSDVIITQLEDRIDQVDSHLPPLTAFILPQGNAIVMQAHEVRVQTRRCERALIAAKEENAFHSADIKNIFIFLNRLSDYFFVLARKFTFVHGGEEIIWRPSK